MEHMLLKAATVAVTDQGIFEAVISSATIDREKDIVSPAGMVRALKRWMPTGKKIPLAWQHSTAAEDIIGWVDPSTAKVVGNEVVATGWIDQSIPRGKEAWRLVKSGVLGFSFGYLVPVGGAVKRAGGGRLLNEFDVFEITATPTPMQNDTRVLAFKGHVDEPPELVEQWQRATAVERELRLEDEHRRVGDTPPAAAPPEPVPVPESVLLPAVADQFEKAFAIDRERAREDRAAEERQLPEVPPAPPPAPRERKSKLVVTPDPNDQWRRAVAHEREQLEADRQAEAKQLPNVSPAPAQEREPPSAPPALEDQWRRATSIEREQHDAQRAAERKHLPEVPPAPEPEAPAPDPPAAPDGDQQWRKAVALEREQQDARRMAERERLPEVPPSPPEAPTPEPVQAPALEQQWQRATAVEREQLQADRAAERRQLPEMPPPVATEEKSVPEPPEVEEQRSRASALEREIARERRSAEERYVLEVESKAARDVGPHAREKLHGLIAYYMKKPHPFTECVRDNRKRFGPGAEAVCATLKDIGAGTTHWRHGGKPGKRFDPRQKRDQMGRWNDTGGAMPSMTPGPGLGAHLPPPGPMQQQMDEWAGKLLDAAGGNLQGLIEMLHEHMRRHGDTPPADTAPSDENSSSWADWNMLGSGMGTPAKPKAIDHDEQDRKAARYEREAERAAEEEAIPEMEINQPGYATLRVPHEEMDGIASGELKAVWSAAFINDLPDSSFLWIEDGGSKDADGKTTPRSLRHFPYKDASGKIDLPHLRNALARIPQSNAPPAVKDRLSAQARRLLSGQKSLEDPLWSASYIQALPDEAFLHVEGGFKYFPIRDATGAIDAAHVRHALSQVPQSDLPTTTKDQCMREAQRLLGLTAQGRRGRKATRLSDSLRAQADEVELEFASDGLSLRKPPQKKTKATSPTLMPLGELRRRMRQEMLTALSGVEEE